MHHLLILTKYPDEYRERIQAAALPDLAVVATADVAEGLARAPHSDILLGDPTRVKEVLPHLRAWSRCWIRRYGVTTCSPTSGVCSGR
jgi:hypothetical protein